ncbi:MAG: hypothetical protein HFI44_13180 [Lachnospiraceae bacterium]|nr:hypothetical protein [Lachnospiraceae bacterium]
MTTKIQWHDRFNIGVESVDKAHQRLFSIVNKMVNYDEEDEKGRQWVCAEGIKYFKNYTLRHFADEEAYMQSINYSGYVVHKRVHDDLKEKTLPALEKDMVESDYSVESVQHFLGICIGWLTGHIMLEDHAITGRISNKWKYERTEELSVLEEAVSKVIKELLGLEAQVISEHYAGEDFGKRMCYRLAYRNEENKKTHVFFVMEEKLLLHIINQLLGKQLTKVSKVVVDAGSLIAQQFLKRVGSYYNSLEVNKLEKVNILSTDQLSQDFGIEYPQYSMLFNTGVGYFALSVKN